MGSPVAQFPGSVVTDFQLMVAVNGVETQLVSAINATATSFIVQNSTGIVPNCLLTFSGNDEIVCVSAVSGNLITVGFEGNPALGRGFNGTTAASHVVGETIIADYTAWHQRSAAVEIEAIEAALGAGLVNVTPPILTPGAGISISGPSTDKTITNTGVLSFDGNTGAVTGVSSFDGRTGPVNPVYSDYFPAGLQTQFLRLQPNAGNDTTLEFGNIPFLISSDYQFTVTPGGSLSVGSNTVNLFIVPLGVNGSDTNHKIYISGGTGTPETVLITGGTAISGGTNLTITFTCLYAHTGAWTIQSATCGIQEAINSLPTAGLGGGQVQIPAGNWVILDTISINNSYTVITGIGRVATILTTALSTGPLFNLPNSTDQNCIRDMQMQGPGGSVNQFAVNAVNQAHLLIARISIVNFGQGISNTGGGAQYSIFQDILINNVNNAGVYISTTLDGGTWINVTIGGQVSSSIGWDIHAVGGLRMYNCGTLTIGTGMWLRSDAGNIYGIWAFYCDLEGYASYSAYGLRLSASSASTISLVTFVGGGGGGFEYGLIHDGVGTIWDICYNYMQFLGNMVMGGLVNYGTNLLFNSCLFEDNGSLTGPGLSLLGGTNIIINGGVYAAGSFAGGANNQTYGITIQNTANCRVSNLIATPNRTAAILNAGGNTGLVIKDVVGYNPVGISGVTLTGGSPFTYTCGPSNTTLYMYGATTISVTRSGTQIQSTGTQSMVNLAPGEVAIFTYTGSPTLVQDIQ
jgi:hypothetical protein